MPLEAVHGLLESFGQAGIPVWIAGGWGVDAVIGRQSRWHADLDVALSAEDLERARRMLAEAGFTIDVDWRPTRLAMRHPDGREIDLHPVEFDGAGNGIQRLLDGGVAEYPAADLVRGSLGDREVRCLSARLQATFHTGYAPTVVDHFDMHRLAGATGVDLAAVYALTGQSADGIVEELVAVDGAELWTATRGRGRPVVLCHGGPGLWDDQAPVAAMIDDVATVHRFDQRGCGRSTGSDGITVASSVDDLEALRTHWGHESWIVAGHSWGAGLVAAYTVAHPDRVDALVSISGTGCAWAWHGEYREERDRRLGADAERVAKLPRPARRRFVVATDFAGPPQVDAALDGDFDVRYDVNVALTADWRRVGPEVGERLRGLPVPVVAIAGASDPRPVWAATEIAASARDGWSFVFPDVGHFPWLERPELLRDALRAVTARL